MFEKDFKWPTLVLVITLFSVLSFGNFCLAQEKEEKKIPSRQLPIEERDQGDSFIEIWANYPAISSHFPLKLFSQDWGLPPGS